MTRTYALMEVSQSTYDEISKKLTDAGYDHAFVHDKDHGTALDMHGIAVVVARPRSAVDWDEWQSRSGWSAWAARHGRQCGFNLSRCPDAAEHKRGPAR